LITLGNGVCGFLSISSAYDGFPVRGAWLILLAMVFDALDGRVARATRTTSAFGAQLDSLSDLISFGVAPAFLVRCLQSLPGVAQFPDHVVLVAAVFYAMAVELRLARFNVETTPDLSSHLDFRGLPSPGGAGVVASLVILAAPGIADPRGTIYLAVLGSLPAVLFVIGLLMVSRVRYSHVVNKVFGGYGRFTTLIEVVLALALVVILHEQVFAVGFVGYALAGPLAWTRRRLFHKRTAAEPGVTKTGEPRE
jgi:CDP-diacylglycerol--serine O-phosphatidyltransferase